MTLHFHLGDIDAAKYLVQTHHYSGLMPPATKVVGTWHEDGGLFGDSGPAVAACVFGIPAARWSIPVLELVRLVRTPECDAQLSGLVAATVRWVKSKGEADLVVSMADSTQDHHGGIYQACSWNYNGQRPSRMDGVTVNGKFMAGRAANHAFGTRSPTKLQAAGVDAVAHFDTGKHLYWKSLTKAGKRQAHALGLQCNPYPKPDLAASFAAGDDTTTRQLGEAVARVD